MAVQSASSPTSDNRATDRPSDESAVASKAAATAPPPSESSTAESESTNPEPESSAAGSKSANTESEPSTADRSAAAPRRRSPVPPLAIALLIVVAGVAFFSTLSTDVGREGRTWVGWLDTTEVTTTDYQPLVAPDQVIYPTDFPTQFQLAELPDTVTVDKIDTLAVYRLDGQITGYSLGGRVERQDDTSQVMQDAFSDQDYEMEFWLSEDKADDGQFWIKWNRKIED
ncbi:MAG: hypothetical protein LBL92_05995 [Propionibacteriaceae bacterium]|jgi:hypothetical protein|nr:hypothetical protein [Propionibacteriaceae bacterium]